MPPRCAAQLKRGAENVVETAINYPQSASECAPWESSVRESGPAATACTVYKAALWLFDAAAVSTTRGSYARRTFPSRVLRRPRSSLVVHHGSPGYLYDQITAAANLGVGCIDVYTSIIGDSSARCRALSSPAPAMDSRRSSALQGRARIG